jgi:alanine racemase
MKQYNRVCARINLDAIAYNMEQMKNRIGQEGRLIAVIKTDAYGHGAVPLAEMFEETPYIWGYAVACMGEARTLRAHGIKKPILILGCVFPDEYEEMVEKEIRAAVYTEEIIGKDITNKKELSGAHLQVKNEDGEVLQEWDELDSK